LGFYVKQDGTGYIYSGGCVGATPNLGTGDALTVGFRNGVPRDLTPETVII